jgi:ribonucleoside-diphosphate reductase alpha chain
VRRSLDYKFYDLTIFSKYAKYLPEQNRREDWNEIVSRYELMITKYPKLEEAIKESSQFIRDKKKFYLMRALQFAGPAAEVNNARYTIVVFFLWITLQVLVKLCFYY